MVASHLPLPDPIFKFELPDSLNIALRSPNTAQPSQHGMSPSKDRKRHPKFWLDDGSLVLLVEDCLFNVHRSTFTRHSQVFRDMVEVGSKNGDTNLTSDGETEEKPLQLLGDKAVDWERFFAILYHDNDDCEAPTFDECDSRLKIATKYEFRSIKVRTLLQLLTRWPMKNPYNYADFIVLGRRHRSLELLMQGYLRAWRAYPLSVADGKRLQSEDLVWLMQLASKYNDTHLPDVQTHVIQWFVEKSKSILSNAEQTLPSEFEYMWRKISRGYLA